MPRRLHDLSETSPRLVNLRTKQAGQQRPRLVSANGTPPSVLPPGAVSVVKRLCIIYMTVAFPAGLLPVLPTGWLPLFICTWAGLIALAVFATFSKEGREAWR